MPERFQRLEDGQNARNVKCLFYSESPIQTLARFVRGRIGCGRSGGNFLVWPTLPLQHMRPLLPRIERESYRSGNVFGKVAVNASFLFKSADSHEVFMNWLRIAGTVKERAI